MFAELDFNVSFRKACACKHTPHLLYPAQRRGPQCQYYEFMPDIVQIWVEYKSVAEVLKVTSFLLEPKDHWRFWVSCIQIFFVLISFVF